ncbi:MAG: efflux RND transporter periplasmic adaptor subunit [Chromatocurvus sp.]
MTKRYRPTKHSLSWLACALTGVSLLASGCGKSNSSVHAEHEDHAEHSGTEFVSTAHTHDNPDETCFICDPSKRNKGRLWCKEHGRYEDRCWLCHAELEDKDRLYCKEHALYEDECFLCHPEIEDGHDSARSLPPEEGGGKAETTALFCNEHGVPEAECAICQPDLAAALEPGESLKVRFLSESAADKAGIRTERAPFTKAAPGIKAYCEVAFNRNRMAKVTPMVGGIIHEVLHDVGDDVAAGDVLVQLHSAEVATAKSDYLAALVELDTRRDTFEREKRLNEQQISAEREFLDAQAVHRTARLAASNLRQKLLNLGLTEEAVAGIEKEQDASAHIAIRAPFAGTLVERNAVYGEAIEEGHTLFTVADLSTRWLELSVPARHIAQLNVGQTMEARFPDLPGQVYTGAITWIDSAVDPHTRMVCARAVAEDPERRAKTGLFGEARILIGNEQSAAVVPRDAVQRHEGADFVFVQDAPDLFSLRRVVLSNAKGENIHILAGVNTDDRVVVDNSFIVMSEFLKSRLGAGCVHE